MYIMTLNTSVYITSRIDPLAVFKECSRIINASDSTPIIHEVSNTDPGVMNMRYAPDEKLDAWLWLRYRKDDILSEAQPELKVPEHYIRVDFDTASSYRDSQGRGAGAFHANILIRLGEWLDEKQASWCWLNEYNGKISKGSDTASLFELIDGDQKAMWE